MAVDAVEFLTLAGSSEVSDLDRAAGLFGEKFLAEFDLEEPFDAWVRKTRNQLDSLAARLFETRAKLADARGEGEQAIQAVERLLAFDPLREDWQHLAFQIYARYRDRERAVVHADELVALLKTGLGVGPELATRGAIDGIRRQDAALIPPQDSLTNEDASAPMGRADILDPSSDDAQDTTSDSLACDSVELTRRW